MIAKVVNGVTIQDHYVIGRIQELTVSLQADNHWDMYQVYKQLPSVVEFKGTLFGKSGWNSDKGIAVYRNDKAIALTKE